MAKWWFEHSVSFFSRTATNVIFDLKNHKTKDRTGSIKTKS